MNQEKIGSFLKELRKEKGLTQEQFSEIMNVSGRTVSRWETGKNMPDLALLISIAEYYEVELGEILDGERKSEKMNKELEETVLKVANYSNEEKEKVTKCMHLISLIGVCAFILFMVLEIAKLTEGGIAGAIADFSLGVSFGALVCGVIFTSRAMGKIRAFKLSLLKRKEMMLHKSPVE